MSQFTVDLEECARMMYHAADCINYYIRVTSYPDCNSCGRITCQYKPKPGQQTRINCPLWLSRWDKRPEDE